MGDGDEGATSEQESSRRGGGELTRFSLPAALLPLSTFVDDTTTTTSSNNGADDAVGIAARD